MTGFGAEMNGATEKTGTVNWGRMLALCLFLACLCTGCASKAPAPAGPDMLVPAGQSPLSDAERAILAKNKGSIAASLPASADPYIEQQAAYFLRDGRRIMNVFLSRSEKYLPYTKQVFRSYNLPEELAYLAMVESGYNTQARSRAGAAGAWQFMQFTGTKYGLQLDQWQDERCDIFRATHAAALYLKKLHDDFGDWPTAIAAYNAGEGKMSRACKAAGERTFFGVIAKNGRLDEQTRLRDETCQYVPRFLAVAAIMNNLGELGFAEVSPGATTGLTRVRLEPGTSLEAMARSCDIPWSEFKSYNPHFLTPVSHATKPTNAYVPSWAGQKAVAYAARPVRMNARAVATARPAARGGRLYTLRRGDTLSSVARTHNTSVAAILAANHLQDPHALHVGQTLTIPGGMATAQASAARKSGGTSSYSVQPKDNLWQISRKLNVSVDDLKRWNRLDGQGLRVGQRLVVLR